MYPVRMKGEPEVAPVELGERVAWVVWGALAALVGRVLEQVERPVREALVKVMEQTGELVKAMPGLRVRTVSKGRKA
jgi:hypothetical protein